MKTTIALLISGMLFLLLGIISAVSDYFRFGLDYLLRLGTIGLLGIAGSVVIIGLYLLFFHVFKTPLIAFILFITNQ